jgi:putative hemolysin
MVARIFRLADLRIGALMTPRTEIDWFDTGDSPDEIRGKLIASPHSHFPVASGDLDSIQGIVHAADVLERLLCNQPLDMNADLQRPLFVPETTLALSVFDMFKKTGNRIAVVIDEYGGVQGLVTLTDILEEVVGDVTISQETIEPQIVQRDDGSWLLDGLVSIQRLADLLGIAALEDNARYETLGGFVMSELGRIPTAGDFFVAFGYRFEVMDMDGHRVDKVLVMPAPLTAAPE